MSRTTKSTLTLARMAYEAAERELPRYGHRFSPKKFTQPQLIAILVLKEAKKTDYRGIVQELAEWRELREAIELPEPDDPTDPPNVPHYSTLCKAAARLLGEKSVRQFIDRHARSGAVAGTVKRPDLR
jgi:hypothetical protein